MRRRWQDATSRSEEIAADVHESTTPLLRQIRALQEDGRARAQAWASAEASFMERSAMAEDAARAAEQTEEVPKAPNTRNLYIAGLLISQVLE